MTQDNAPPGAIFDGYITDDPTAKLGGAGADLVKLWIIAQAATEGPCVVTSYEEPPRREWEVWTADGAVQVCAAASENDARYRAALTPEIVISLLDRITALERAARQVAASLDVALIAPKESLASIPVTMAHYHLVALWEALGRCPVCGIEGADVDSRKTDQICRYPACAPGCLRELGR